MQHISVLCSRSNQETIKISAMWCARVRSEDRSPPSNFAPRAHVSCFSFLWLLLYVFVSEDQFPFLLTPPTLRLIDSSLKHCNSITETEMSCVYVSHFVVQLFLRAENRPGRLLRTAKLSLHIANSQTISPQLRALRDNKCFADNSYTACSRSNNECTASIFLILQSDYVFVPKTSRVCSRTLPCIPPIHKPCRNSCML